MDARTESNAPSAENRTEVERKSARELALSRYHAKDCAAAGVLIAVLGAVAVALALLAHLIIK